MTSPVAAAAAATDGIGRKDSAISPRVCARVRARARSPVPKRGGNREGNGKIRKRSNAIKKGRMRRVFFELKKKNSNPSWKIWSSGL